MSRSHEAAVAVSPVETIESVGALIGSVAVDDVDRPGLCDVATAIGRVRSVLDGLEARVAAAIEGLQDKGLDAAGVLRSTGKYSQREAARRARRGAALTDMPRVADALTEGTLTAEHADAMVRAAEATSPDAVDESGLIDTVRDRPADLAAKQVRDWIGRHQTEQARKERYLRRRGSRRCVIFDGDDGMTVLHAEFDPVTGAQIRAAIASETNRFFHDDGGRGVADEVRTVQQRRADAVASMLGVGIGGTDTASSGIAGSATETMGTAQNGGRRSGTGPRDRVTPRNQIVLVAEAGVVSGENPDGRCEIAGVGPVPKSELDRLACDAEIFGILFSGDGDPLWHGRGHRTATAAQWRALVARDGGCVLCGAAPHLCEAHHIDPWGGHGNTDIDRLALLCRREHHDLHDRSLRLDRTGAGIWVLVPDDPDHRGPP